jgi:hypothetical protein
MDRKQRVKLFAFISLLAGLLILTALPAVHVNADGPGGFPTSTTVVIIIPTFTTTPTNIIVPTITSPYPYPLPQNNTLNLALPEAQAETAVDAESGRGLPTILCIPLAIVAVIAGLVGLNRIRKNYQGG